MLHSRASFIRLARSDNNCQLHYHFPSQEVPDNIPLTNLTVEDIVGRASIRNTFKTIGAYSKMAYELGKSHSLNVLVSEIVTLVNRWEPQGDEESY